MTHSVSTQLERARFRERPGCNLRTRCNLRVRVHSARRFQPAPRLQHRECQAAWKAISVSSSDTFHMREAS